MLPMVARCLTLPVAYEADVILAVSDLPRLPKHLCMLENRDQTDHEGDDRMPNASDLANMLFPVDAALIGDLLAAGVRLRLVGSFAMLAHGIDPEREPNDVDLMLEPTLDNSARVCEVLRRHALPIAEGPGGFSITARQLKIRPGVRLLDLLTPAPEVPFADLETGGITLQAGVVAIPVASLCGLIALKQSAIARCEAREDRTKHEGDLALLLGPGRRSAANANL